MSIVSEQRVVTSEVIKCDFCDHKSNWQMYKCFGCGKDLCIAHTIYDSLYLDYGSIVYLCVDCHSSFSWLNLEAKEIISDAQKRADAIMSTWKASRVSGDSINTKEIDHGNVGSV